MDNGNCARFPVAPGATLAHHPGMIRKSSETQPAEKPEKLPKGVIAVAPPSFRRERALIKRGIWPIAGCDEAGRGPLAGPVVAAAVVLDPKRIPKGIDDSKRLSAERREELFEEICTTASFAVAFASPARIDRDNILRASLWALARAVHALPEMPKHVFVDGRDKLDTSCDCDAVIGGDALVLSIAAASITRPPDVRTGAGLSGLRLRAAQGLWRAGPFGGAEQARSDGASPPLFRAGRGGPGTASDGNDRHRRARDRNDGRGRNFRRHLTPVASAADALYQTFEIGQRGLPVR
jgi:hypothetical protein